MKETDLPKPADSKKQLSNITRSLCLWVTLPLSYLSTNKLTGTGICTTTTQYILTGLHESKSNRPLDTLYHLIQKMKVRLCAIEIQSGKWALFMKHKHFLLV